MKVKAWLFSFFAFATTFVFADDAPADAAVAPERNMSSTLIMVGIALVFFYFILWRPEQKRRKALESQRSGIKKGDRVTAMGIIGTVVKASAESNTVILRMYDGAQIEVLKAAISDVKPGTEADSKEPELASIK